MSESAHRYRTPGGGCGDRITRAQRWEANKHAQQCHEISPST